MATLNRTDYDRPTPSPMKGRKGATLPSKADPMKLTWTRDSVVSLKTQDEVLTPSHVFRLTDFEIEHKVFQLRYHTCSDAYYRLGSDAAVIEGWENGIYAAVNMERHIDDELAYLTRTAGHRDASISWKVDLTDTGLVVDSIQALTLSRTLAGGIVTYDVVSPDAEQAAEQSGCMVNGWQTLYFIAYLNGSRAENTYDQTQLLYQSSLDDQDNFPLDILITLKPLQEFLCTCTTNSEHLQSEGTQELVEIHPPPMERCTCYFPNNKNLDSPLDVCDHDNQRMPLAADSIIVNRAHSTESLSVVNNHAISLPGTPIHRKHYGNRASSGSSHSLKLSKRNRVQSLDPGGYDNSGADSPIRMHALRPCVASEDFELQELEVGKLERVGSRVGAQSEARKAWTDGKQRDIESLVGDDGVDSKSHFCSGSLCTIL